MRRWTMPIISEREMEQRKQVAALQVEISKALEKVAKAHGDLTTTVVAMACVETAARWLRYEIKDEEPTEKGSDDESETT